jgi:hypothetical protein
VFFLLGRSAASAAVRQEFVERVAQTLGAHPTPGPGYVDRSVRRAFEALWVPPPDEATKNASRWTRATPAFERVSKRAY